MPAARRVLIGRHPLGAATGVPRSTVSAGPGRRRGGLLLRAETRRAQLLVGVGWVALTVLFEIGLGRLALGYSWERLLADYDLARGGLLPFGLVILALAPLLAPLLAARLGGWLQAGRVQGAGSAAGDFRA